MFSRRGRPTSNQRGPGEEGLAKERVANDLMLDEGYGVWVSKEKTTKNQEPVGSRAEEASHMHHAQELKCHARGRA